MNALDSNGIQAVTPDIGYRAADFGCCILCVRLTLMRLVPLLRMIRLRESCNKIIIICLILHVAGFIFLNITSITVLTFNIHIMYSKH